MLFPLAVIIRVVLDNLNTQTPATLYQTVKPAEDQRILSRYDFLEEPYKLAGRSQKKGKHSPVLSPPVLQ